MEAIISTSIPGAKKLFSGKVRDIYEIDDEHLLIISTDRLSAFDHVFPNGIPGKGIILNTISNLWFSNIKFIPNHIVETDYTKFPKPFCNFPELVKDRAVIVKQAKKIDYECISRGYIIGSGWVDYLRTGKICGITLPENLKLAQKLPEPIFTPSTKAKNGHDENVSISVMENELGKDLTDLLKTKTVEVYKFALETLKNCGIIIADTKIEFGLFNDELILIDEVLTPDSSRFWDVKHYEVGSSPFSYDKQFVRDFLETTSWDKNSPPPPLPDEIIAKTQKKYEEILIKIRTVLTANNK